MAFIIYLILGYWAYSYLNEGKTYIYSGFGGLLMHTLIMGFILGIILIPLAVIKLIYKTIRN